jgi:hypothetical protein
MNQQLDHASAVHCANCGTPMEGEFCHHCGQSIHSVLKPVHHMFEDGMDMVLHVDGRIVHTLPPLLLKPGFLTLEYFSGRRVRYIAPFRLMFVLCLLAFAICHLALDGPGVQTHAPTVDRHAFSAARSPAEVQQLLDAQLAKLDEARKSAGANAAAITAIGLSEARIRTEAANRLAKLRAPASASSSADDEEGPDDFGMSDLHAHPVNVTWLPSFANRRLNTALEHMQTNLRAVFRGDDAGAETRERVMAQLFSSLPQVLFVMIPLFAVLLKVFYLFKRRLYMEHLIVALHSHAFLFLALLLGVGLALLRSWLAGFAGWAATPVHLAEWALFLWIPVYLLLMQKRIYRQGWAMTLLKYFAIGWCYLWMLGLALLVGVALSLTH